MKSLYLSFCILLAAIATQAQEDSLMTQLEQAIEDTNAIVYTTATFKTNRLLNAHSVETLGRGVLDIKIQHRFGTLDQGIYELFGLDNASIRIGGDYGITDWLMTGIGRSSFGKQYDAFLKAKLLRQSTGRKMVPVTVSAFAGMYINTIKPVAGTKTEFADRVSYVGQLIVARKFSEGLSLQLSPTIVQFPGAAKPGGVNTVVAMGVGGRQKLSKRVSLNLEYYYQLPDTKISGTVNPLSVGFDIETGGHVFQLIFTNSTGIAENQYISGTTGKWEDGEIHFGFNIARVFTIGKRKKS